MYRRFFNRRNKWRPPSLFWIPFLFCYGLLFAMSVFQLQYFNELIIQPPQPRYVGSVKYLVKTPECQIPDMQPMDPSIVKYIEEPKPIVCNNGTPPLIDSNLTSIFLLKSSLSSYGLYDTSLLTCCYTKFWRTNPKEDEYDNHVEFGDSCIEFSDSVDINDEFIKVECAYSNSTIYKDFFAFVPRLEENKIDDLVPINKKHAPLNVLIVGIDAVSRLNLHRHMSKTVSFLLQNISAVEMLGYNKVGDNTFPNLIPVLTGLSEEELVNNCWPTYEAHFDACPFIWKNYSANGFTTAIGEDAARIGLFNHQKRGFIEKPTDYMWSVFNWVSENQIGNENHIDCYECVGSRPVHQTLIEYINKFYKSMASYQKRYFGFFWSASLTHDYLNKPKLGDDDYVALLEGLYNTGALEQTVLVFLSDHGFRWGSIRTTYQGRMEERLPFVFIALPKWYREEYPQVYNNLRKNMHRLTTPFDLHETLADLLNPYSLTSSFLSNRISTRNSSARGFSLFEPIPINRTCDGASISSHWCTCQQSFQIDKSDITVVKAARFAVEYMNKLLDRYADCAILTLNEILDARIHKHGEHILIGNFYKDDYNIKLKTTPGDAIFDVTVRKLSKDSGEYHFNIAGTISRLNLYGKQSLCITDFHLKLYCYCKNIKF